MGLGHLQVIAEDLVNPTRSISNIGPFSLLRSKFASQMLPSVWSRRNSVELGGDTSPNDSSLFG